MSRFHWVIHIQNADLDVISAGYISNVSASTILYLVLFGRQAEPFFLFRTQVTPLDDIYTASLATILMAISGCYF